MIIDRRDVTSASLAFVRADSQCTSCGSWGQLALTSRRCSLRICDCGRIENAFCISSCESESSEVAQKDRRRFLRLCQGNDRQIQTALAEIASVQQSIDDEVTSTAKGITDARQTRLTSFTYACLQVSVISFRNWVWQMSLWRIYWSSLKTFKVQESQVMACFAGHLFSVQRLY